MSNFHPPDDAHSDHHSAQVWQQAAELFDQVATVDPEGRRSILSSTEITPEVRAWLDKLLAAHDRDQTALIDQQMTELVQRMLPGSKIIQNAEAFYQRRFGPWQAGHEIGRGGMGLVLEGHRADGQFDKRVAIKLLDPVVVGATLERQLKHELRLLASLSHPAIAQLLDGGVTDDEVPYLVMEFVDGMPLNRYCDEHELNLEQRLDLFDKVADAVSYCHRRLVVHGDIKPDNVLVSREGQVKLLDFGIASRLSDSGDSSDSGEKNGLQRWCSPAYAAPERLKGAPAAVAEDVYALAAMLYELVTGSRIRSAPEMTRLVVDSAAVPKPRLASEQAEHAGLSSEQAHRLKGDLDAILNQALAVDPAQRYADVDGLSDDLQRWRLHYPVRARAEGTAYLLGKWLRRNRTIAASAGLIGGALLIGLVVSLWQAQLAEHAANEARQAQLEAEYAGARADSINRFLLDLFEAQIPDLPPDQLPTTRQIIDQGIVRARDPAAGSPALRAELLLSLAEILRSRLQLDETDALLDEIEQLLRVNNVELPDLELRLAVLSADVARRRNQLDLAEPRLLKAIALYQQYAPDNLIRLEMQRDLARVWMRNEQWEQAGSALQALGQELEQRTDAADLALRVAGDLAIIAASTGQHDLAIERFERILEMKQERGLSPNSIATTEVNLASLQMLKRSYAAAEVRYLEIIDRLQPYTEVPRGVRATAYKGLSDIMRVRGQFDQAEGWLNQAANEWARLLNLADPTDDFFIYFYRANIRADADRHGEAAEQLAIALELMQSGGEAPPHRIGQAYADRARCLCQIGEFNQADQALERALALSGADDNNAIVIAQAQAVCALVRSEGLLDPELIPDSMISRLLENSEDAVQIARLELTRAALLIEAGHIHRAQDLIQSARARLEAVPVQEDHPLYSNISALASSANSNASSSGIQ